MLKTVATYSFPYEAQISRAKLDSQGIPAFVADEQTINMQWLYSNALGGVRLQVPEAYVEQALDVLSEDGTDALEQEVGIDATECSECGSTNTEPFQKGKRWAFLVFLGLDFPLFPVKNTTKCKECGHVENA
jgi:hypothetical protein